MKSGDANLRQFHIYAGHFFFRSSQLITMPVFCLNFNFRNGITFKDQNEHCSFGKQ